MSLTTIIVSRSGISTIDGLVSMEQAALWAAGGPALVFAINKGDEIAPAVSLTLDSFALVSIGTAIGESDLSETTKLSFSMALGGLAAAITAPAMGPAFAVGAGEAMSTAFEHAYDEMSEFSKAQDWSRLFDLVDDIRAEWGVGTVPDFLHPVGESITVNQYEVHGAEFVVTSFNDKYGVSQHQFTTVSGEAAAIFQMPTTTVTVSGSFDSPTVTSGPLHFDLSEATLFHSASTGISSAGYSAGISLGNAYLGAGYEGNTVDFAGELSVAAGLQEYGVGSHMPYWDTDLPNLDPGLNGIGISALLDFNTLSGEYAFDLAYILGNSMETLVSEDHGMWASMFLEKAVEKLGPSKKESGRKNFIQIYLEAGASPVAVDLNGDGVQTVSLASSDVTFDITGDGIKEHTAWLSQEDAFIVFDGNSNGSIDGVSEMFGGMVRGEGYAELSKFDSNGDAVISALDEQFNTLSLWRDLNANGKTEEGELQSLLSRISHLNLNYQSQEKRQNGNLLGEVSEAVVDGELREMADVYFRYSKDFAEENQQVSNSALPSVASKASNTSKADEQNAAAQVQTATAVIGGSGSLPVFDCAFGVSSLETSTAVI